MWEWLEARGDYLAGIQLYYTYSDNSARKRYWRQRERSQGAHSTNHLRQDIRDLLNSAKFWRAKNEVQSQSLPTPKLVKAKPKQVYQKPKEELSESIRQTNAAIQTRIRQLAQQRAKLSNKLCDPGDDPEKILHNCMVIDEITPITDHIRELDLSLQNPQRRVMQAEDGAAVVVGTLRGMRHTYQQLVGMEIAELQTIQSKIREGLQKAKKRADNGDVKEATRKRNAEKVEMLKREIRALTNIISDKKWE